MRLSRLSTFTTLATFDSRDFRLSTFDFHVLAHEPADVLGYTRLGLDVIVDVHGSRVKPNGQGL